MSQLEGNRLRIKLVKLQLEMQQLEIQYKTYTHSLFSIMIVTDLLLFVIGLHTQEALWFVIALCVTISFVLTVNVYLERWFLIRSEKLKTMLSELEKRYLL